MRRHLFLFAVSQQVFLYNCITRVKCSRLPVDLGGQWIFALQYNILSAVKHFIAYEPVSRLFWATDQYSFEVTISLQGCLSCMLHRPTLGWTVVEYILRCQSIQASSTVQPRLGR